MGISEQHQQQIQYLVDHAEHLQRKHQPFLKKLSALAQFPDEDDISAGQKKYLEGVYAGFLAGCLK